MATHKTSLKKSDLKENTPVRVEVDGKSAMVVLINGNVYAINALCSHHEGPLNEGTLDGFIIECPWHGAKYDVRNGQGSDETPWGPGQESYPVKMDGSGSISLEF